MTEPSERKLISVLFCDLVGSTALGEQLDPEAFGAVQQAYFDRVRSVIERHEGTVEKFVGDAIVAVFGVPRLCEDDAERAMRCALDLQAAIGALSTALPFRFEVSLSVRIGVNTGEAFAGGADVLATGDVMNTAARLEQAAAPGQILVGRDTMRLTRHAMAYVEVDGVVAKGKAEPVAAWAARGILSDTRPRRPIVGRATELERLEGVLGDVEDRSAVRRSWSSVNQGSARAGSPRSSRDELRTVRRSCAEPACPPARRAHGGRWPRWSAAPSASEPRTTQMLGAGEGAGKRCPALRSD